MNYKEIISYEQIKVNEFTRPLLREGKRICKKARRYVKKARSYICHRYGVEEFLKILSCFYEIKSAFALLLVNEFREGDEERGRCWRKIKLSNLGLFNRIQNVISLDAGIVFPLLSEVERLVFKLDDLFNRIHEISSTEKNEEKEEK